HRRSRPTVPGGARMSRSRFVIPLMVLCSAALLIAAGVTLAKDAPKAAAKPAAGSGPSKAPAPVDEAKAAAAKEAMEQMMKLGAPGAAHEKLKAFEGNWKATVKMWE